LWNWPLEVGSKSSAGLSSWRGGWGTKNTHICPEEALGWAIASIVSQKKNKKGVKLLPSNGKTMGGDHKKVTLWNE